MRPSSSVAGTRGCASTASALAAEHAQASGHVVQEQRAHAHPITRKEQASAARIVHGEGEIALQPRDAVLAPAQPGLQDQRRIAALARIARQSQRGRERVAIVQPRIGDHAAAGRRIVVQQGRRMRPFVRCPMHAGQSDRAGLPCIAARPRRAHQSVAHPNEDIGCDRVARRSG